MSAAQPDPNLLFVFEAIFHDSNLTRAGVRLGLSQPAVSLALARLRDQFADPLFVRTGNELVPTRAARNPPGRTRPEMTIERVGGFQGDVPPAPVVALAGGRDSGKLRRVVNESSSFGRSAPRQQIAGKIRGLRRTKALLLRLYIRAPKRRKRSCRRFSTSPALCAFL
jgi:hypothetical protein